jgi:branched-chain amino acid transport system substrate-binding protein
VLNAFSKLWPNAIFTYSLLFVRFRRLCVAGGVGLSLITLPMVASAGPGVTDDEIVFGQVAALTGPAGALGRDVRTGILAAFAEVNRNGGVKGRALELVSRDDGYEPTKSVDATKSHQ